MSELALDHGQRHPLPGELDRVRMTERVRRKPAQTRLAHTEVSEPVTV